MSTSVIQQQSTANQPNNNNNNNKVPAPEIGPAKWTQYTPVTASGKRQSPINIIKSLCTVKKNVGSRPLRFEFPTTIENLEMINSGHGWTVVIPPHIADKTALRDGPLNHTYKLAQFHAHWGCDSSCGSEHTIDGKCYSAELHFVNFNSDLFPSFGEAVKKDRGLSVIAVFLDVADKKNEQLEKVVKYMHKIQHKDERTVIPETLSLADFFPEKKSYFTYEGSLTTPPYHESVTWIVFENPVSVTADQIGQFRQLMCTTKELVNNNNNNNNNNNYNNNNKDATSTRITENYRLAQPLNGREIVYVR